ncbi:Histidine kinase [Sulfidibacter corallicola]|uniref:Histidine kinase n=1 Tax=Sulfidibacter corallicola TaxID=2818388 RepID=A0A8A4TT32_SULCO|nr:histidine kinase [Sulfidibacter corallicola]QTD49695.1 histidine kinase [Sulfidibacter corallicola]
MNRLDASQVRLMIGLWCLLWAVYTVLHSVHGILDYQRTGGHELWKPVLWESSSIAVTGLLFFAVWWFTFRFPFVRRKLLLRLGQHALAAIAFSLLHIAGMNLIRVVVYRMVGHTYTWAEPPAVVLGYEFSKDLPTYASMVVVATMLHTHQSFREKVVENLNLERELVQLQAQRLREQLRPHFLFNALNLVSATMFEDVEKADRLLVNISALLRHSLQAPDRVCIPLAEELHYLKIYLTLIGERFDGRTTFDFEVAPELDSALIPRFLLQPLAENAVNHGFRLRNGRGTIVFRAHCEGEDLILEIEDDGCGLQVEQAAALTRGIGLSNTVKTLNQLYGERGRLQLLPGDLGGLCVRLGFPYRVATDEEHAHALTDYRR